MADDDRIGVPVPLNRRTLPTGERRWLVLSGTIRLERPVRRAVRRQTLRPPGAWVRGVAVKPYMR